LGSEAIRRIADIQLAGLRARVEAQDIGLKVTDAAIARVADVGFDPHYGARPLKRAIQDHVENALARLLLEGRAAPGDTIVVDEDNGRLAFRVEKGE
ncbi:protein containing Clp ATPase, partial [gut metagenome]